MGLVTVALVAGCSSTTSGSGSPGNGSGGQVGVIGSGTAAPPTNSGGSGSGSGGGAAGTGNFCHDWNSISSDLGGVTAGNVGAKIIAKFDALAAEAPPSVKPDVENIAQYLHGVMSGKADPGKAQQLATSFEHVGEWIAQNC